MEEQNITKHQEALKSIITGDGHTVEWIEYLRSDDGIHIYSCAVDDKYREYEVWDEATAMSRAQDQIVDNIRDNILAHCNIGSSIDIEKYVDMYGLANDIIDMDGVGHALGWDEYTEGHYDDMEDGMDYYYCVIEGY